MFAQQLTFLKKQSLKICIYLPSNDFDLRSSYSETADWNEPKMLVTSTERAIVESEVSFRFREINPIPFLRLATLKYRSISIRSPLSLPSLW